MVAEQYDFFHHKSPPPSPTLGILAFDAANTMRRLIALYNSLTDAQILTLRTHTLTSLGVTYLNSKQECFLLNLACAEHLNDLDRAAATVSRFSRKCSDPGLNRFDLVYSDLKRGIIGPTKKLQFRTRSIKKSIDKMKKLVFATSNLHVAMECLSNMEASKICKLNMENFYDEIAFQRKQVTHYEDVSLWNQTFDKTVKLMGRVICVVYARISSVFGPYISGYDYPSNFETYSYCLLEHRELYESNHRLTKKLGEIARNDSVLRMASASTVGGSGLTMRYARVIMLADSFLHAPETVGEREREELYEMLPERVKAEVRKKLKRQWRKGEEWEEGGDGRSPAEGWREAAEEIMEWLRPVARDTVTWHEERSMEKQRYDTKPTTLLLQTLHFSDLDKVEAAIVEVLVGLSCIYRYEKRRR